MTNRDVFAQGEWYHCFNRGVEKRDVFENEYDANRFLMLLYLSNGTKPVHLFNARKPELRKALQEDCGKRIVSIGAYCLMPNHYHLLLKEITEGGITAFMRKLGTAYAMYFNANNERVGNLFLKPFRSRHVKDDRYFQRVLQYIHCNPAELYEPGWKSGKVRNMDTLQKKLVAYPYSSLAGHVAHEPKNPILSADGFEIANQLPLRRMLDESRAYYAEVMEERFER